MNFGLLWDWEQASGFDAKQAEEMCLERGRFGQFHEPRSSSSLPHPAGDFIPGGEFPEQAVEAVHGESILGSSGTSFLLNGG